MPDDLRALADLIADRLRVPTFLNDRQAARYLGLSPSRWARLKSAGELPKPRVTQGTDAKYHKSDLDRWASERHRAGSGLPRERKTAEEAQPS